MKVNIKKIHKASQQSINMLNALSLWDMEFYKDDEMVHVPDENIREWELCGDTNLRFIEHIVKRRRYLVIDVEEERNDEDEIVNRQDPVFIQIKITDGKKRYLIKPRSNLNKYLGRFPSELKAREFCRENRLLCDLFVIHQFGYLI